MMEDGSLYTLRQIAAKLSLPESTVRYYRDIYSIHLPTIGTGRRRLYAPEAVEAFRTIARAYADGHGREHIEAELSRAQTNGAAGSRAPAALPARVELVRDDYETLLATVLDGERERREVMWQMAREIVRLGEAMARQHEVVDRIATLLTTGEARALLPARGGGGSPHAETVAPAEREATDLHGNLSAELRDLREALTVERELVERLRRSKLEMERRAAQAESRLEDDPGGPSQPRLVDWLRTRMRAGTAPS